MIKFRTYNNGGQIGFSIGLFGRKFLFWYDKSGVANVWPPHLNHYSHDALYIGRIVIDWDKRFRY